MLKFRLNKRTDSTQTSGCVAKARHKTPKHEQRVRHSVDLRLCPVNLMKFRLINHRSPWRRWIFEAVEAEGCKDPPEQIHAGSSHGKIQISSTCFLPSFMFFLKSGVSLNWDRNSLAPPPSPSTRFYTDEWKRGAFVLITIIIIMAIRGRLKGRKQRAAFCSRFSSSSAERGASFASIRGTHTRAWPDLTNELKVEQDTEMASKYLGL